MNCIKWFKLDLQRIVVIIFVTSCIVKTFFPVQLLAQESSDDSTIRFLPRVSNESSDAGSRGSPDAPHGTGTRGECIATDLQMTPLVGYGNLNLTVSDRPTFWVYVPYTPEQVTSGKFSLQDGEKTVYTTPFTLPKTPGVVSISLPSTVPALDVGKKYRWFLTITCPQTSSSEEPTPAYVTGIVERISLPPEIENLLNTTTNPLEKIQLYASNGIWYETLTEFAKLRLSDPQNTELANFWMNLLESEEVNLDEFGQEPIVGDIIPSSQ
jgi:Domain of Unknown Function (DUF928)